MNDQNILRESSPSSSSPTSTNRRDDGFRSCNDDSNHYLEDDYNREEGDIEIGFTYQVEIDTESLSFEAERIVFDMLSEEIVKSIHATYCGDGDSSGDDGDSGGGIRRRQLRRTLLNQQSNTGSTGTRIDAIASGSFASTVSTKESCEPHVLESLACNRYKGTLIVGYSTSTEDEDGTNNETEIVDNIENTVLDQISDDMTNNRYLVTINDVLLESEIDFKVTRILFEGLDFFEQFKDDQDEANGFDGDRQSINKNTNASATKDNMSLTQLGKLAVVWIAILCLTMMFAFFSMRRSFSKSRNRSKGDQATIVADDNDENDAAEQNDLHMHNDDDSFVSIECRNLGEAHSKEVQRCNQPNCSACSRRGRLQRIEEERSKEAFSEIGQEIPLPSPAELFDQKKTIMGFFTRKTKLPPVEVIRESTFEDEPSTVTIDKRIRKSVATRTLLPPVEVIRESTFEDEPSTVTIDKRIRKSVATRTLNLRPHSNRSTFRWLFMMKPTEPPPPVESPQEILGENDDPPGVTFVKVDDPYTGFRTHCLSGKLAVDSVISSVSSAGYYLGQLSSNSGDFTSDRHSSKRKHFKNRRVDMSGSLMSFDEKEDSPTDEECSWRYNKPEKLSTSQKSSFESQKVEIDSKKEKDSGKSAAYSQDSLPETQRIITNAIKESDSRKSSYRSQESWSRSQESWSFATQRTGMTDTIYENDSENLSTHSKDYSYTTQRIKMHDKSEWSSSFSHSGREKSLSVRRSGSPFRTRIFGDKVSRSDSKTRRVNMLGELDM